MGIRDRFVTFALTDISGLRESEYGFGILPYPMYDEAQNEYNNLISTGLVPTASIPYNNKELERTGATLEAMAYYSVDTPVSYTHLSRVHVRSRPCR